MVALKGFFYHRSAILFILILAFILRILLLIGIFIKNPDGIYVYDSYGYWQLGYNIVHYFSFSQSYNLPLEPDYFRTPIYPLFIALAESIGPEGFSIIFLQIIISVLTCYITYRIAIALTENLFIANIAALLVTVDLPSIVLTNLVLTETLFTFLLVMCFYFFINYLRNRQVKQLVFASVLSGLMILCKPIAFFIPFFFSGFIIYVNRKNILSIIKPLFLLSAFVMLIVSPWLIRNKIVYDHYFLSVIREHNLLNYQAAAIYAERFDHSLAEAQSILRWKTFREFKEDANKQPYEYAKFIEKEGSRIIFENPAIFIKQYLKGVTYFFLKPTRAYIDIQLGHWGKGYDTIPKDYPIFKYLFEHNNRFTVVLVFFQLIILLLVYLACAYGLIYIRRKTGMIFLLLFVLSIFIFASFNLSEITESRFRVPTWPLIAIVSACGVYYIKKRFSKRKTVSPL
jgi:4-amino-4-deoxy-L-arabinose transferase-like glycosyltransferase